MVSSVVACPVRCGGVISHVGQPVHGGHKLTSTLAHRHHLFINNSIQQLSVGNEHELIRREGRKDDIRGRFLPVYMGTSWPAPAAWREWP